MVESTSQKPRDQPGRDGGALWAEGPSRGGGGIGLDHNCCCSLTHHAQQSLQLHIKTQTKHLKRVPDSLCDMCMWTMMGLTPARGRWHSSVLPAYSQGDRHQGG